MSQSQSSRDDRVNEAIAAYLQAVERGEKPDRAVFLAQHADISSELISFLEYVSQFRKLAVAEDVPAQTPSGDHTADRPSDQPASDPDQPTMVFRQRGVQSTRNVLRYFGDYELIEEIARGGMGVVYKARQVTLNRIVAVKMILSGQFAGPEDIQRFYTEAEAAAQLDHPGIVPIYEVGEQNGQHYFSMGFVEGQSLAKRVAEGPLEPNAAAEMVKTVSEAVQYAHDKGVIHRDLKPGNILLDMQGRPRVTDFGLAKLTESGSDLTGTGQILGTPSYMPPEQAAAHVSAVGRLSDVYSLGAILYCLLTGRPPFQAANPLETLLQVQKQEPVSPRQLNPNVPHDLDTIVLKCLDKSPNRRYSSAQALADELNRYLEGRPILARRVSRVERFWRWCRREPIVAGLCAAVILSLIVGTAVSAHFAFKERERAESESKLAIKNGDLAIEKGKLADEKGRLAEENGQLAQTNAKQTEIVREKALETRHTLYIADMSRISDWAKTGNVAAMRSVLNRYFPTGPGDADLRAFEWYYWWNVCHAETRVIDVGEPIRRLIWSPDGKTLVCGTENGRVEGRSASTGERTAPEFQLANSPIERMSWKAGSDMILAIDQTSNFVIHHIQRQQTSVVVQLGQHNLRGLPRAAAAFSDNGDRLFAPFELASGQAVFLDLHKDPLPEDRWEEWASRWFNGITIKELPRISGDYIFSESQPGASGAHSISKVRFNGNVSSPSETWDFNDPAAPPRDERGSPIFSAAFSPSGEVLVLGLRTGELQFWDVRECKLLRSVFAHQGIVWEIAFADDGETLASAGADGVVKLWSTSGTLRATYSGHQTAVHAVCFGPGGVVLSGSDDGIIHLWQSATGIRSDIWYGHMGRVSGLTISPDRAQVASSGLDGTIRVWTLKNPHSERQLSEAVSLAWLPSMADDGRAFGCIDSQRSRFRFSQIPGFGEWDLPSGQMTQAFHYGNCSTAPLVSKDGRFLAFSSREVNRVPTDVGNQTELYTLRLWNCVSHRELSVIPLGEVSTVIGWGVPAAGDKPRVPTRDTPDPQIRFLEHGTKLIATTKDQRLIQIAIPSGEVVAECPLPFVPGEIELRSNETEVICIGSTGIALVSIDGGHVVANHDLSMNSRISVYSRDTDELVVAEYEPVRQLPLFGSRAAVPARKPSEPKLEVFKLPEFHVQREIRRESCPTAIALSPDGKRLAVCEIQDGHAQIDVLSWPEGTLLDRIEFAAQDLPSIDSAKSANDPPSDRLGVGSGNVTDVPAQQSGTFAVTQARFDNSGRRLIVLGTNRGKTFSRILELPSRRWTTFVKPFGAITSAQFHDEGDQWIVAARANGLVSPFTEPLFPGRNPIAQNSQSSLANVGTVSSQEAFLGLAHLSRQKTFLAGPYPTRRPVSIVAALSSPERFLTSGGVMTDSGRLIHGFVDESRPTAPNDSINLLSQFLNLRPGDPDYARSRQQLQAERVRQQQQVRMGSVLAVSHDGTQILIDSQPGSIAQWSYDIQTGLTKNREFSLDCRHLAGPAWAPDDKQWLVGADTRVLLMTAAGEFHELEKRDSLVSAVAFSLDGRWAATGANDGVVRLYETTTWTHRELRGHRGRISALAFVPDKKTLASTGLDGALRFWDLASGEAKFVRSWDGTPLHSLAFDRDGEELLVGGEMGRLFWCRAPRLERTTQDKLRVIQSATGPVNRSSSLTSTAITAFEDPNRRVAQFLARTATESQVSLGCWIDGQRRNLSGSKLQALPLGEFAVESIALPRAAFVEPAFWQLLPKLSKLETLILSDGNISADQAEILGNLRTLSELRMRKMTGMAAMKSIPGFPSLKRLELHECDCTDESLEWLSRLGNLETCQCSGSIGDVAVSYLAKCHSLCDLTIQRSKITDRCFSHIAELPQLCCLNLADNDVGDAGVSQLANQMTLKFLNLDTTNVSNAGIRSLSALRLRALFLRKSELDDQVVLPLIQIMSTDAGTTPERTFEQFVSLRHQLDCVDLRGTRITKKGAFDLVVALDQRTHICFDATISSADPQFGAALWALQNSGTFLVDGKSLARREGLEALLAGAQLTGLTVRIPYNFEQWSELHEAEHLVHLTDLELDVQGIRADRAGREDRGKILASLRRLPALERLTLDGVSSFQNIEIMEEIGPLSQLKELSLKRFYLRGPGTRALQAMPNLRTIKYCLDTDTSIAQLRRSLPNCQFIDNTFELLDSDNNGEVSEDEFRGKTYRASLRKLNDGGKPLTFPIRRDEFLKILERNDPTLTFSAWQDWAAPVMQPSFGGFGQVFYQSRAATRNQSQWATAAFGFGRMYESAPDDVDLAQNWAYLLFSSGKVDQYRSACEQMRKRFGESVDAKTALILSRILILAPDAMADTAFLIPLAERAVELGPENWWTYHVLAGAHLRNGNDEQTLRVLDELAQRKLKSASDGVDSWLSLILNDSLRAIALLKVKRTGDAREVLARIKQLSDQHLAEMPNMPFGELTPFWWNWYPIQAFHREAEELLRESDFMPVTQEQLFTRVPKSFSFELDAKISDPEPGKRDWKRIGDKHFIERLPSGKENKSRILGRIEVSGAEGTIVERIGFEKLQVFIPDRSSENRDIKYRFAEKPEEWVLLGKMEKVE